MNDLKVTKKIAELVSAKGGRVYFVGGYVRDKILGIPNKDIDIEVHGIEPMDLQDILNQIGKISIYGSNFGIYSLKHTHIDIALPRKEEARGTGHRDFEVYVDPYIGLENACKRRDFTINSMLEDVLTGEIIDFYGGKNDLANKVIRHTNTEKFVEDPLRVLRACQFASRFDFTIDKDTIELCKTIDLKTLTQERIKEEVDKVLIKGNKPSVFFNYLREMNQLDYWFKEIKDLIDVKQNPVYHSEGDVYTHTMLTIDNGHNRINDVNDKIGFMYSCLCHDFGKAVSTYLSEEGVYRSIGHEETGVSIAKTFLNRLTNEKKLIKYVTNMVANHMRPNICANGNAKVSSTSRMFSESIDGNDLIYLSEADALSSICTFPYVDKTKFLFERFELYKEIMARPFVNGKELLASGVRNDNPSAFHEIMDRLEKCRLSGIDKKTQFFESIGHAKELNIFDSELVLSKSKRNRKVLMEKSLHISSKLSEKLNMIIGDIVDGEYYLKESIEDENSYIFKLDSYYYVINSKHIRFEIDIDTLTVTEVKKVAL